MVVYDSLHVVVRLFISQMPLVSLPEIFFTVNRSWYVFGCLQIRSLVFHIHVFFSFLEHLLRLLQVSFVPARAFLDVLAWHSVNHLFRWHVQLLHRLSVSSELIRLFVPFLNNDLRPPRVDFAILPCFLGHYGVDWWRLLRLNLYIREEVLDYILSYFRFTFQLLLIEILYKQRSASELLLLRQRLLRVVSPMHVSRLWGALLPLFRSMMRNICACGCLLISFMLHTLNIRAKVNDLVYLIF
jgi:hypothetical protein